MDRDVRARLLRCRCRMLEAVVEVRVVGRAWLMSVMPVHAGAYTLGARHGDERRRSAVQSLTVCSRLDLTRPTLHACIYACSVPVMRV